MDDPVGPFHPHAQPKVAGPDEAIGLLIDENKRLRNQVSQLRLERSLAVDYLVGGNEELMGLLNASRDRAAELEAALRPFADVADAWDDDIGTQRAPDTAPLGFVPGAETGLNIGHCRKAREVLDWPKVEHPIAREKREADENRRRLQKEYEAEGRGWEETDHAS